MGVLSWIVSEDKENNRLRDGEMEEVESNG
jgi:hypothetical protein